MVSDTYQKRVLIAEDDPIQCMILEKLLKKWEYEVITTSDGKETLRYLKKDQQLPLVILDWNMPGMNGLDVVKHLREQANRFLYLIMITGNSELDDMELAFAAGVDDFITKPVNKRLLQSRIRAAERIIFHELELQVNQRFWKLHADSMERLVHEQAQQLVHADRMVTIGTMSAGIAHEINNPTSFISGNAQTLKKFWVEVEPIVVNAAASDPDQSDKLTFILQETPKMIDAIMNGVNRISKIVNGLKSFSHQGQDAKVERCKATEIVESALSLTVPQTKNKVAVQQNLDAQNTDVMVDRIQIEQVLINLVVNATHALEGVKDPQIDVQVKNGPDTVIIEVADNGPGLPEAILEKVWIPFFTTKEVGKGTGLGLPICRKIVERSGGEIRVENKDTGGACFSVILPHAEN